MSVSRRRVMAGVVVLLACATMAVAETESAKPKKTPTPTNINTASVRQLMLLPAIGQKRAQDIVDYRKRNGPFKAKEDIMDIHGIGEKTFQQIKSRISVKDKWSFWKKGDEE